jgi:ferredoxin
VALVVLAGFLGVFVVGGRLFPLRTGYILASTQFVPSLVAFLSGASLSLAFAAVLAAALAFGRIYCCAFCPLGLLQDAIATVTALFVASDKNPRRFTRPLTWLRQFFLWATVAVVVAGWSSLAISLTDPYSHFGRISAILFRPALIFAARLPLGGLHAFGVDANIRVVAPWAGMGAIAFPVLVLGLVVVLTAYRDRLYCNSFCPVGTLLGAFSRWSAFRVSIDAAACRKCGECSKRCKAHCIDLRTGAVDGSRCVACFNCLGHCENDAIHYRWQWKRAIRATTSRGPLADTATRPPTPALDAPRRAFLTHAAMAAAAFAASRSSIASAADGLTPAAEKRRKQATLVVPPGAESAANFNARCTACQLCVGACPTGALQPGTLGRGSGGLLKPRLDFTVGSCAFLCHRCGQVCPTGAIGPLALPEKQVTRIGISLLDLELCEIRSRGVRCSRCVDGCPTKALTFTTAADGIRIPTLQPLLCIGCGICEHACPVRPKRAITVIGRQIHNRVRKAVDPGAIAGSLSTIGFTTQAREPVAASVALHAYQPSSAERENLTPSAFQKETQQGDCQNTDIQSPWC